MLISFVIPHYNLQQELLQRCIASIITQNIPTEDYEILIVDDGSNEPPIWIKKEYNQKNIKLIISKHGGLGAARNVGQKAATGEYIQFIDSDDCLIKESIPHCIEILKKENPDILQHGYKICHTEADTQEPSSTTKKAKIHKCGADYVSQNNLSGNAWLYMFKKRLADNHNIHFAEGVMHEDEDFTLKIYHYGKKLIRCNRPIYNYCIRKNSITSSTDDTHEQKRIKDLFLLLERTVTFRNQQQEKCSPIQRKALERKTTMLTVDTLLNLFYNGKNSAEIEKICHGKLSTLGLYPLPPRNYSLKYTIFATLANSSTGLKILRKILPAHKPQKK